MLRFNRIFNTASSRIPNQHNVCVCVEGSTIYGSASLGTSAWLTCGQQTHSAILCFRPHHTLILCSIHMLFCSFDSKPPMQCSLHASFTHSRCFKRDHQHQRRVRHGRTHRFQNDMDTDDVIRKQNNVKVNISRTVRNARASLYSDKGQA